MDDPPSYKQIPLPPANQPGWLKALGRYMPKLANILTRIYLPIAGALTVLGKGIWKGLSFLFRVSRSVLGKLFGLPVSGLRRLANWIAHRRTAARERKAERAIERAPRALHRFRLLSYLSLPRLKIFDPIRDFIDGLWAKWWIRIPTLLGLFLFTIGFTLASIFGLIAFYHAKGYDISKVNYLATGCEVQDRNGDSMGRVFVKNHNPVYVEELPPHFLDALIATEDERFFEHGGNDLWGIARATFKNLRSQRYKQGASTITQQLARNVYGLHDMSILRKLTEIFLARRIENNYDKWEILEHYLNRIYMGNGCWGVGAAANSYFNKEISELTVAESALLCGIIKRPSAYSPFADPKAAVRVRNHTLERMVTLGYWPASDLEWLKASPVGILPAEIRQERPHYLVTQSRREAQQILEARNLPLEGFIVQTSVDSKLQNATSFAVNQVLQQIESLPDYPHLTYAAYNEEHHEEMPNESPDYLQAAVVVLHNATGRIIIALGGRDFSDSQFNRVFEAKRPAGTAFIPLVYAAAFEKPGISPLTPVIDAPMDNRKVMIGGESGVLGEWGVEHLNNHYEGEIAASYALLRSKNAATVRIGAQVGLPAFKQFAARAGIESELRDYPSTYLGSSEVTPLELARAYTLFANRGWAPRKPALVEKIKRPDGTVIFEQAMELRMSVLSETSALQVSRILQATLYSSPARAAREEYGLKIAHVAAKTGTAYGFTDAWCVGFDAEYTCAVWVGFDRPKPIYEGAFGHKLALPIWVKVMNLLGSKAALPHPQNGIFATICLHSGAAATTQCQDAQGQLYWSLPYHYENSKELGVCPIHQPQHDGERPVSLSSARSTEASGIDPIVSKSPVLIGQDPYLSVIGGSQLPEPEEPKEDSEAEEPEG